MSNIVIFGAGGHGQVVADIVFKSGEDTPIAFFDDDKKLTGKSIMGIPVINSFDQIDENIDFKVVVAVGTNRVRKNIYTKLKKQNIEICSVIHPTAILGTDVELGEGCMICAGAIINTGAKIGSNCIINTNATVEHHCTIKEHSHIAPNSTLGGEVYVCQEVLIGISSTVIPRVTINKQTTLGAGAIATKDLEENTTYIGIPARKI